MKKNFLGLLVFVILINISCSQTKLAVTKSSLLWEISGNGLTGPSYLLGTSNFEGKSFVDSLSMIGEKLKTCKLFVDEAVVDSSQRKKIVAATNLPEGSFEKIFTSEEYDSVKAGAKSVFGPRIDWINSLKPAALEQYILLRIANIKITKANPGMHQCLLTAARENSDQIVGLETPEFYLDLFFNTPLASQKKRLLFCMREMDAARKNINDYRRAYRQQDIESVYNLTMYRDKEFTTAEKDVMMKDRNLKWIEKLPDLIKAQPSFIAVPAFHLAGEFGLINQFRLKGYTVMPVKI